MAVYDINGNVISGGGGGSVDGEILNQMYYTLSFDKWQQGKLDDVAVGSQQSVSASTTNYCTIPANAVYLEAGTVIKLTSSTTHDLSYKRLDETGKYLANMQTDGLSGYTYMRGTSFQFALLYDGYYCFNSYNSGYSDPTVAKGNLENFIIYGSEYIKENSSFDLWRDTLNDSMRTVNHRGYTANGAVANTMPAYAESKNYGYIYVECDLRLTSDNEIVLSHDPTITGTSGGISQTLTIASSTLSALQALTLGSGRFECQIATLDELLEFCRINNMHPYLDMKETSNSAMDLYFACVVKHGMLRHVSWSGNATTSAYIKNKDAKARLVNLGGTPESLATLLNGQNEVVVNDTINNMSATGVANYASAGITVECYKIGVPTTTDIKNMASYGVTGMTIDKLHCQKVISE